jgi:hypothetical protein
MMYISNVYEADLPVNSTEKAIGAKYTARNPRKSCPGPFGTFCKSIGVFC